MTPRRRLLDRANECEVVVLRPEPRHRTAFLDAVERSRDLHGSFVKPPSDADAFDAWLERSKDERQHASLVICSEVGALVGVINLNEIVRGAFQSAYLGYYAFVPGDGAGLMSAGMALVLEEAFRTLGLHRVEANLQPSNDASRGLVQTCGFRREGVSPRYLKIAGRWRDHERWALLREEWQTGTPATVSDD